MDNNGVKWFFLLLVLLSNGMFLVYWAYHMRIEVLKGMYFKFKNKPKLFKIMAFMSPEKFYEKYLKKYEKMKIIEKESDDDSDENKKPDI